MRPSAECPHVELCTAVSCDFCLPDLLTAAPSGDGCELRDTCSDQFPFDTTYPFTAATRVTYRQLQWRCRVEATSSALRRHVSNAGHVDGLSCSVTIFFLDTSNRCCYCGIGDGRTRLSFSSINTFVLRSQRKKYPPLEIV